MKWQGKRGVMVQAKGPLLLAPGVGRGNGTRHVRIGFSSISLILNIDIARDPLFLDAVPFLTLPYLLI